MAGRVHTVDESEAQGRTAGQLAYDTATAT